jgi:ATP-binding cassette subfamily B protein
MRETLRGVRLMLAISWRADAPRSVAAALTATGQYVVLPVRALGLKLLADGAVSHDSTRALTGALLVVGLSAANRIMAWASLTVRMRLREHTQLYLDTYLMGRTAGIPGIAHHELPEYLDSMERLRGERHYLANPFNPISWTLASILQTATVMALMAGVQPVLALLPLVGVPAAIATGRAEQRAIALLDEQAEDTRLLRHLMDLSTEPAAAKEVRIYGLADELLDRRAVLFRKMEDRRVRLTARTAAGISAYWALFGAAYAGAIAWTVHAATVGRTTVGAVVLILTLGAQLNNQLAELALNVAWFSRSLRAVRRLVWFDDHAAQAHSAVEPESPEAAPARLEDGIRFQSVAFSYPGSDRPVLRGVDIYLPAGSTVAIVGENGAGKTTLVKLLARLYEPTQGSILIDGIDLRTIGVDDWRTRLSAGFQDFARFQLVVRRSVGVGDIPNEDSDPHVEAALSRAVASDLPHRLPLGLDTQLGAEFGGAELSIGQWQKVALGRAMMRPEPLLLILDEPTASLDAPTEHALFEHYAAAAKDLAERTGGVTILISHRFSTVRMADLILVISHGVVQEAGTHQQLLHSNGLYSTLYRLQARGYQNTPGD